MVNVALKTKILERGLSQLELAQKVGLNDSMVSSVIRGWTEPSPDVKRRIAAGLRCAQRDIFVKAEPKP